MSDDSSESCDDTDIDPDYEGDTCDSDSEEGLEADSANDSPEESLPAEKNYKVLFPDVNAVPVKADGRPCSPSGIGVLNLSESDSSSDEELLKTSSARAEPDNKSVYFSEISQPKCENTEYDFSHILALQNNLSKARERHEKEAKESKDTPSGSKIIEPSILELLALGEKTTASKTDSCSESENESEPEVKPSEKVIEITLDAPLGIKKLGKSKKRSALLEKHLLLLQKQQQLTLHKVHLLCLIAHGKFVNINIINNETIYGHLLSLLPEEYSCPKNFTPSYIKKLLNWFGREFDLTKGIHRSGQVAIKTSESLLGVKKNFGIKDLVLLFVSLLRGLGLTARFVSSLQPVPLVPKRTVQKKTKKEQSLKADKSKTQKKAADLQNTSKGSGKSKSSTLNRAGPSKAIEPHSSPASKGNRKKASSTLQGNAQQLPRGVVSNSVCTSERKKYVKVISSDSEESQNEADSDKVGIDYWVEAFIEQEEKWICVDIYSLAVDCPNEIYARCTQPVAYIIGWKNDNTLKDVTRRYVPTWHRTSKKNRVDQQWYDETISYFRGQESIFDKLEEESLDNKESEMQAPIPTKISDLKNHPLYALQRHLLKFEGIYPPDAKPLGYVRGEAVYSRFCIHELFSREKWIRQGKSVKVKEMPYKIVKSRSKSDKFPGIEKPLELFGYWQVDDYMPPPVIDNKVPRNEYGNIEIYKPCMLPAGTVHLQVPGILRIAKKMNIDCAPAVTGWEHHAGRSHPIIDGVVVCKEYQDVLLDAWCAETDASSQRSDHRRKQNSYKKWLKFAKHALIKVHLKRKYNFGDPKSSEDSSGPSSTKEKKTL